MCHKHPFHSLNILFLLEACENIQIILRFDQCSARSLDVSPVIHLMHFPLSSMHWWSQLRKVRWTHSVSSTFLCCLWWSMTAFMSRRAFDNIKVGMFWNSLSLRSAVASLSPCGCSCVHDVGAVADILLNCYDFVEAYERYFPSRAIVSLWCKQEVLVCASRVAVLIATSGQGSKCSAFLKAWGVWSLRSSCHTWETVSSDNLSWIAFCSLLSSLIVFRVQVMVKKVRGCRLWMNWVPFSGVSILHIR